VEKELRLAAMLVENLAAPFEPEKYHDTYREKIEALIAAKIAGQQTVESPQRDRQAPVVNIMEALERSLATMARKPPASQPLEDKTPKKRRAGGK
jgi:DNA end-binding protein Ku